MTGDDGFLDLAYGLDTADATRSFYKDWAKTYDAEVRANGYASPGRCAAALAAVSRDLTAPLLDLGCGTGLSGVAFRIAGFTVIDGSDFSGEMLERARSKDLYRTLTLSDLEHPIAAEAGQYSAIAAVGVFSPGHAPAAMIERVLDLLPPAGHFVFTLNDHAIAEKVYETEVDRLVSARRCAVVHDSYGAHLPARDLGSRVLVLERV